MITAREVRPDDVDALLGLFEAAGSPCYCRYWHFEGDKNAWLARCAFDPETSRSELAVAVSEVRDEGRGVVALEDGALVGWAKVAPSRALTKLYAERYYRGLVAAERTGVWTIGCFLVRPDRRLLGVAGALVGAAVDVAARAGASVLEAFPRRVDGVVADEELWRGTVSGLAAQGFVAVAGDEAYPVMRRAL